MGTSIFQPPISILPRNNNLKILNQKSVYQVVQISGVLEHQQSVADHLENSCSERQHIRPSFAAKIEILSKAYKTISFLTS